MAKTRGESLFPRSWQFSPDQMTTILSREFPGVRVSRVELLDGSDGTSSRARLGVEYAEGAGPESVFAKTQGDFSHRFLHLMTGNLYREALLYGSGIALPLEHPRPYHGSVDRLRLNELVVMEDLTPRGVVLFDATKRLGVDDVASGLRGLAALHSRFWRLSSEKDPALAWAEPWKATWTFRLTLRRTVGVGIENLRDSLSTGLASLGAAGMEQWWTRYIRTVSRGPLTLLHGDAHVGNTYRVPGCELGFLDWACVRKGNWAFDVGYFLVSALDVEERRRHDEDLVEEYRRALDVPVEDRPTRDQAWLRYRSSIPYGLAVWLATASSVNYQSHAICSNLVQRFGCAFEDLDTPGAIAELG